MRRERTQPRHLYSDKGWRMSQHGPVLLGDGQSQRTLIPSDFPALQGFLPTQPRWASSLWLNPSSDVDLGVSPKAPTPRLNRGPFCTLFLTLPSASLQTAPAHAPPLTPSRANSRGTFLRQLRGVGEALSCHPGGAVAVACL